MFAQARALPGRAGNVYKTVLLAVVLLLPMGFVTLGYVDIQRGQVAFSSRERDGVAYLRPALGLLAGLAKDRPASGVGTAEPVLAKLVADVDAADARYGGPSDVSQAWSKVKAAMAKARSADSGGQPGYRYSGASAALVRLIVTVSDTSNLTLDPDLDSYYLMDALAFRLPVLLDLNAQVVAAVSVPATGPTSQSTRLNLARIAGALASTQTAVDTGMSTALAVTGRAQLGGVEDSLRSEQWFIGAMLAHVDRAVRTGNRSAIPAVLGDETRVALVRLVDALLPELDALLATRIVEFHTRAYRVAAAALAAVLMVGVLMIRFHRSGVDRRRSQLRASLVRHAAVTANSADTFAAAAVSVQRVVCAKLGWSAGHAWTTSPESDSWHIADHRHRHQDVCRLAALAARGPDPDGDLPARTRITSGPRLSASLGADVEECGIGSAVAVPVLAGGEAVGTLAFYLPVGAPSPHPDLLSGLEQVGMALGRVVEREQTQAALIHQANHDPVTGLANRWRMLEAISAVQRRLTSGQAPRDHSAVLLINLDRFALINDSLGYAAGDLLLQRVAERLSTGVRPDDLVARLGADEFAVLAHSRVDGEPTPDPAAASDELAQRLLRRLHGTVTVLGHQVPLRASMGVCAVTDDPAVAGDPEGVLRDADSALRQAKLLGRDQVHTFDAALRSSAATRLGDEAALAEAVSAGRLEVHYQPIINLETGQPVGVEALARWPRPEHGMVPPDRFIALAEESGLILDLGRWVLRQACQDAATWRHSMPSLAEATVSVNVSTRQLVHPRFLTDLDEALHDSALPPDRLVIEITETALIGDPDAVMATLQAIRRRGMQLALDDFGTGYSSLSYVQNLPVTILKIDKSFVDPITGPGAGTTLSEVVLKLAEATGLRTVAEGVESRVQAEALRLLGCHSGQGYTWSRPVSRERLPAAVAALVEPAGNPLTR